MGKESESLGCYRMQRQGRSASGDPIGEHFEFNVDGLKVSVHQQCLVAGERLYAPLLQRFGKAIAPPRGCVRRSTAPP